MSAHDTLQSIHLLPKGVSYPGENQQKYVRESHDIKVVDNRRGNDHGKR